MIFFNNNAFFISLSWVFIIACDSQVNSNVKPETTINSVNKVMDSTNEKGDKENLLNKFDTVFMPERKISEIDNKLGHMEKVDGFVLFEWQKDTLKLELFLQKGKPAKLSYTTFDDAGIASGLGAYYFDSSGKVFANRLYYDDKEVVEIFLGNHEVLKYGKKDKIQFLQMNKEAQLYREVTNVKTLDDYMMVLNCFNYTAPKPSKDAWAILKVNKPVNLYELPDENSRVLSKMNKSASLKYLGNNRKQSIVGELTWVWYHVSTKDEISGWVFGHPELISERDDETE